MDVLKFHLSLYLCQNSSDTTADSDHQTQDGDAKDEVPSSTDPPLIKNVLGEGLYSSLHNLFQASSVEKDRVDNSIVGTEENHDPCSHSLTSVEVYKDIFSSVFQV